MKRDPFEPSFEQIRRRRGKNRKRYAKLVRSEGKALPRGFKGDKPSVPSLKISVMAVGLTDRIFRPDRYCVENNIDPKILGKALKELCDEGFMSKGSKLIRRPNSYRPGEKKFIGAPTLYHYRQKKLFEYFGYPVPNSEVQ